MASITGIRDGDRLIITHEFPRSRYVLAVVRISLGWMFLWGFLDRMFALGYPTGRTAAGSVDRAAGWVYGGSPSEETLKSVVSGPFHGGFQWLLGQAWVDWLFMIGLLAVGVCLLLGIGLRPAAVAGSTLLLMRYIATLPPVDNPFLDDRLLLVLVLVALALGNSGDELGLGVRWAHTRLVYRFPFLR